MTRTQTVIILAMRLVIRARIAPSTKSGSWGRRSRDVGNDDYVAANEPTPPESSIFLDLDKLTSQYCDISMPAKEACSRMVLIVGIQFA